MVARRGRSSMTAFDEDDNYSEIGENDLLSNSSMPYGIMAPSTMKRVSATTTTSSSINAYNNNSNFNAVQNSVEQTTRYPLRGRISSREGTAEPQNTNNMRVTSSGLTTMMNGIGLSSYNGREGSRGLDNDDENPPIRKVPGGSPRSPRPLAARKQLANSATKGRTNNNNNNSSHLVGESDPPSINTSLGLINRLQAAQQEQQQRSSLEKEVKSLM